MNFVIEAEGYLHWIVKCVEKGKLLELHRFYRSHENFLYHRGNHGKQELAAMDALKEYFQKDPKLVMGAPDYRVMPKK